MRSAATIALGLALALTAGACGDEAEVEQAVDGVAAALAEREGERACESLTNDGRRIVAGFRQPPVTCPETVETLEPATVDSCRRVEVRDVRVYSGGRALARVGARGDETRVGLVNIDGKWKLRTPPCGPRIPG